jgi:hypothetical protein
MKMASATLSVATGSDGVFTLLPSNVIPANSVSITGTGTSTQMSLTPQTITDTTFALTFVNGANVTSVNNVTVPVPFGQSNLLTIGTPSNSILVTAYDVAPFQGSSYSFTVVYQALGSSDFVHEDPTIVFNPPST